MIDNSSDFDKRRIVQEYVPGKQVTLAHLIANPDPDLYAKFGVVDVDRNAVGILTITPSEGAFIAADVATKAANVKIVFVDRFSGAVVLSGDVSSVDTALRAVVETLERLLHFSPAPVTRT